MTGNQVYTAFSRETHVTDLNVSASRPLLWAMDFNVDPLSSVIVQTEGDKVKVLDEIVLRNATTQAACEEFLKRYPRHLSGLVIYGDASGFHEQTTGASDYRMIRDYFKAHSTMDLNYRVPKANPAVRERVNLVNAKLRSAAGDISVLVDRKCKELVKDFEQVTYKPESTQIDKDRDRMRTHLSDALGYLLWQECGPLPKAGERGGRIV